MTFRCADHALVQAFSRATSDNRGFVLENMVYIALRRSSEQIYYYKTSRGDEIDFAVGPDTDIQLIQVCWELSKENHTRERELKPLLEGMEELGLQESWIGLADTP